MSIGKRYLKYYLVIFIVLVCLFVLSTAVFAYSNQSTWKTRIDNGLANSDTAQAEYGYCSSNDSSDYAWGAQYTVDGLLQMYKVTGQTSYISKAKDWLQMMYNDLSDVDGDGYKEYGTSQYDPQFTEYLCHDAAVISIWTRFIYYVNNNSTLRSSYGSFADTLLEAINNNLIPKWEYKWNSSAGCYNEEKSDVASKEHNRYLSMADALMRTYVVCPERVEYRIRAEQMYNRFKNSLYANGSAYTWYYSTDNASYEDMGHGSIDMKAALTGYDSGLVFTNDDMLKFKTTLQSVIWNGSTINPAFTGDVNGGGTGGVPYYYWTNLCMWGSSTLWEGLEKYWGDLYASTQDGQTLGVGSMIYSYHPDAAAPQSFSLISPSNTATDQDLCTIFKWEPSVNASHYTLQISTDSNFSTYTVSRDYIAEPYAVVKGLSANTTYYWRVIAKNRGANTYTSTTRSFTTKSRLLTFWDNDNYAGGATGYWYKQLLINDTVVWEKDLADTNESANTWYQGSVEIAPYIQNMTQFTIKFRLVSKQGVSNFGTSLYWDDVAINGVTIGNSDFESSGSWTYSENKTPFSGAYSTESKHGGSKSYLLSYPNSTASIAGDYCQIGQTILLNGTTYTLTFWDRDNYGNVCPGYWKKQVLINGNVIWEKDVCDSGESANTWYQESIDLTPYIGNLNVFNIKFRLYGSQAVSNFGPSVYYDDIAINGLTLSNAGFETSNSLWEYLENGTPFTGTYDSSICYSGANSYCINYPDSTASSIGYYGCINQVVFKKN